MKILFYLKRKEKMTTEDLIIYSFETWISALVGAGLVGCIGLLPIFIVPNEQTKSNLNK